MFLLAAIQLAGVIPSALASDSRGASAPWPKKMRDLERIFQNLLIDLSSDERFDSPKNFKKIEENAKAFADLAHDLKAPAPSGAAPDRDPTIEIVAGQFASQASHAYETLKLGHREYARNVLRSMTSYCIACHTRNGSGPSFQTSDNNLAMQALKPLERANYFAATRQFDRALSEYERIISAPGISASKPFEWEKAIRSALAISVRVKKDPDRALSIVDRALEAPKAPFFLKEQASQWKKSLVEWKGEASARPQTEEGYFAQAVRLIAAAKTLQKYPADRSADILYLRATSVIHDLLGMAPNGARSTEALYLAGLSYEVLQDLNLGEMHEFYFLGCIYKSPHTEKAQECFRHYEESVYFGYTGSAGENLPEDVRKRLADLEALSKPLAVQGGPVR